MEAAHRHTLQLFSVLLVLGLMGTLVTVGMPNQRHRWAQQETQGQSQELRFKPEGEAPARGGKVSASVAVVEQEAPSPSVSDKDGEGEIKLVEDGEEEEFEDVQERKEWDQEIAAEHDAWEKCAESRSPSKPTLEGLELNFFEGDDAIEVSDAFIHQENYDRLLGKSKRNNTRLAPETIALLPRDYDEIANHLRFNSCAVVGNSGYMKMAKFGKAINTHNLVLRLNQSPTKPTFSEFVGTKTSIRLINSMWSTRYASDKYFGKLPLERNLTLMVSRTGGDVYDNIVQYMAKKRPDVKVLLINSRMVSKARALLKQYRIRLCKAGYGPYKGGISPTSGFVASYFLRSICDRLALYGLGTVDVPDVPYHYFLGTIGSRTGPTSVHSFDAESQLLDQLGFQNEIEQCKYIVEKLVPADGQVVSRLRSNFTSLARPEYHNELCGWNICKRRSYRKFRRRVKGPKRVSYSDCKNIMFGHDPDDDNVEDDNFIYGE